MGLLCDYFLAANPVDAEATLDWVGGPGSPPDGQQPHPTISLRGIEPTMWMGKLDEILTGRTFDEIFADPTRKVVGMRDDGERVVVPITTALQDALAALGPADVSSVADRWAEFDDEYGTGGDPGEVAAMLTELVELVQAGRREGTSLYCWICV